MKKLSALVFSFVLLASGCGGSEFCTVSLHYRRAHAAAGGNAAGTETCADNVCEYRIQVRKNQPVSAQDGGISLISEKDLSFAGWYAGKDGKEYVTDDLTALRAEKDMDLYAAFSEPGEEHWRYGTAGWWYADGNGCIRDQWLDIGKERYHFDRKGNMTTGWYYENGSWYLLNGDGTMAKGWRHPDDRWFYFSAEGQMTTGWKEIEGKTYYFYPNGAMAGGWVYEENDWYRFDNDGVMITGMMEEGGNVFWFAGNGVMARDEWQMSEGQYHYFGSDGIMVRNQWIGEYYLNEKGERALSQWIGKYHVGADGRWDQTK